MNWSRQLFVASLRNVRPFLPPNVVRIRSSCPSFGIASAHACSVKRKSQLKQYLFPQLITTYRLVPDPVAMCSGSADLSGTIRSPAIWAEAGWERFTSHETQGSVERSLLKFCHAKQSTLNLVFVASSRRRAPHRH